MRNGFGVRKFLLCRFSKNRLGQVIFGNYLKALFVQNIVPFAVNGIIYRLALAVVVHERNLVGIRVLDSPDLSVNANFIALVKFLGVHLRNGFFVDIFFFFDKVGNKALHQIPRKNRLACA